MVETIESVPLVADDAVKHVQHDRAPVPADWSGRSLYLGDTGARRWLDLAHESDYALHDHDAFSLRKHRLAAIDRATAGTMVSLGPGDGSHDIELVRVLKGKDAGLQYIPVELNAELLATTIRNLRDHVAISAGVLADFESSWSVLADALSRFGRPPVLFSLQGGTVSNLDAGEPNFFDGFKTLMRPGDSLLIDIPLAGPAWSPDAEPRLDKSRYTEGVKRFLSGGLECRGNAVELASSDWFDARIECVLGPPGAIPGTRVVLIRDRPSGRVLMRVLRYDWSSILDWLVDRGFHPVFAASSLSSPADTFGMGVVLLSLGGSSKNG